MLNQNGRSTPTVSRSTSNRDSTEDIEAAGIRIRTGFFNFTENVERPELHHADGADF
jgi:hypothetical protein